MAESGQKGMGWDRKGMIKSLRATSDRNIEQSGMGWDPKFPIEPTEVSRILKETEPTKRPRRLAGYPG